MDERYAETLRKQEEKRKQIRGENYSETIGKQEMETLEKNPQEAGNTDKAIRKTETIDKNPQDEETTDKTIQKSKPIQSNQSAKGGQIKCPKCGSTDISPSSKSDKLICNFCRHEFEPEKIIPETEDDLRNMKGEIIGLGAQDIIADVEDVLTFKCSSCGAEVIIDTNEATQARCHWCRNTLSINQQIPNGAIPDMLLPFKLKKDEAKAEIEDFVNKRKFFAHPKFKQEFTSQNVMGVYLPYMVVDINAHSKLSGQGEHLVRKYHVGSDDDRETRYDADLYNVEREFDLLIDDLTIESSADKLNNTASDKTNNIINTIMPFDTENSVKWNANYLKGFSSEKRDVNIEHLKTKVNAQAKDIARYQANETIKQYDRGVRWSNEQLDIKGRQWKAAYLPVWLYSYLQDKNNGEKLLHYVAVNARTKEIMGSVPIHMPKLIGISAIVEVFGIILAILTAPLAYYFSWIFSLSEVTEPFADYFTWIFALSGVIYFAVYYLKYRNPNARHYHEKETKAIKENLQKKDEYIRRLTGLKNSKMNGANNTKVSNVSNETLDKLNENFLGGVLDFIAKWI